MSIGNQVFADGKPLNSLCRCTLFLYTYSATKSYFAGKRNRKGRQIGRALATRYNEIVCDRTFDVQLTKALQPLMGETEQTLARAYNVDKRARILVRVDIGGGSRKGINWLLSQGKVVYFAETTLRSDLRRPQLIESWAERTSAM